METKNKAKEKKQDLPNLNQCFSLNSIRPQTKEQNLDPGSQNIRKEAKNPKKQRISIAWALLAFCLLGGAGGAWLVDTLVKDENFERKMIKVAKQSFQNSKSAF